MNYLWKFIIESDFLHRVWERGRATVGHTMYAREKFSHEKQVIEEVDGACLKIEKWQSHWNSEQSRLWFEL